MNNQGMNSTAPSNAGVSQGRGPSGSQNNGLN